MARVLMLGTLFDPPVSKIERWQALRDYRESQRR
jgi:hypothetical protein